MWMTKKRYKYLKSSLDKIEKDIAQLRSANHYDGNKEKIRYMPEFSIDEDFSSHIVGNEDCEAGWCGSRCDYPRKCECGGLLHAEFGDEDSDCNFWLYIRCDKCGGRGETDDDICF